ncbi:signal transduction histidine kinase [Streptomyces sp. AK010]|nr:signal transduction histidine kinase [Streptomyces sp. AK010]
MALGAYGVAQNDDVLTTVVTGIGIALAGCTLRLDAEARGSAQRLLAQDRAARAAEAETAALAERARTAREIHDVLAHSLSAQLVHLEAARLLIERGGEREQIHERVVAAREMARGGLAETRQALSALRGELTPLEDFLNELVSAAGGAEITGTGERRALPTEASQAVRRAAQEALANVRKHAPWRQGTPQARLPSARSDPGCTGLGGLAGRTDRVGGRARSAGHAGVCRVAGRLPRGRAG